MGSDNGYSSFSTFPFSGQTVKASSPAFKQITKQSRNTAPFTKFRVVSLFLCFQELQVDHNRG